MKERFKLGPILEVEIQEIPVMSVRSDTGPMGANGAFDKLEEALGRNLKGRKFYGTLQKNEYRANVAIKEEDDLEKLGLERGVIPAGKYGKRKIEGYGDEANLAEVLPQAFESLVKEFAGRVDPDRPSIEHYQSFRDQIIIAFIPIT